MSKPLEIPVDRFYYVRHGETEANVAGTISGQRDVPLTARGRAQAEAAARVLKAVPFDALCASPLRRAWDTADAIARASGREAIAIADLKERNWGIHEGGPTGSVTRDATPEGGESRAAFHARVLRGLEQAFAHGEVVIVAHAGVFRELCAALDVEPGRAPIPNGTPLRFARDARGWTMTVLG